MAGEHTTDDSPSSPSEPAAAAFRSTDLSVPLLIDPAGPDSARAADPAAPGSSTPWVLRQSAKVWVTAATLLFAGYTLFFLLITPTFYGPDEYFQFDRVMAAEHGQILATPGVFRVSTGAANLQTALIESNEYTGARTFADDPATNRATRPSFASSGGNARPPSGVTNYMSQHPPLYYALMGGLTWLVPGSDTMHGDTLIMIIRGFNILLLLGLPLLFYVAARRLTGNGIIARASAFLPLLVPGLARSASTINNDNLAILLGAATFAGAVAVMRGDRSVRIAVWLAALCLAASLTKGTVLIVMLIIPLAYLVQVVRDRRWPVPRVLAVLAVGALASCGWWVKNYVKYHAVQPSGAGGDQLTAALGPVRPPGVAPDMKSFWDHVLSLLPSRFWGALGLLEPPRLPLVMIWVLCVAVPVGWAVALLALRGRRWDLAAMFVLAVAVLAVVVLQSYAHYRHFLSIPALQGRYLYPTAFPLLFGIGVLAVVLLAGRARLAPLLLTGCGLLVGGWGVYTMIDALWLPTGVSLTPNRWLTAIRQIVSYGALPGAASCALAAFAGLLMLAGLVLTVRSTTAYRPRPLALELRVPTDVAATPTA